MDTDVIISIIGENEAETAINNLIEFGVDEEKISLIMKNNETARKIQDDIGPMKGIMMETFSYYLEEKGADDTEIQEFRDALDNHNCILAVETGILDTERVKQTLQDYEPIMCMVYPCKKN